MFPPHFRAKIRRFADPREGHNRTHFRMCIVRNWVAPSVTELSILLISSPRAQFVREGDSLDCKALIFLLLCPCLWCFFFDKLSLRLDNTGECSPLPWHSIACSSNACRRSGVGAHRFCYVLWNGLHLCAPSLLCIGSHSPKRRCYSVHLK